MTRWLVPALFVAAALYVRSYNAASLDPGGPHPNQVLLFPFVDVLFPSTAGKPQQMGARTVDLLWGCAGGLTLLAALDTARAWRNRREADEPG